MSNLIPPLLSSSPPPIIGPLEEEDDEFGDFRAVAESYDCDDLSLPSSPQKSPEKEVKNELPKVNVDINSNSQKITNTIDKSTESIKQPINKDFQDRRKSSDESINLTSYENQVNCTYSSFVASSEIFNVDHETIYHSSDLLNGCQIVAESSEKRSDRINFTNRSDQSHEPKFNPEDDLQTELFSDETEIEINKNVKDGSGQDDFNSFANEENLFQDFSESTHLGKTNSDELSEVNETNEIKSEQNCPEEINSEDDIKDNKNDSLKDSNCESCELSMSMKVGETDPKLSDDEFGNFEDHFGNENHIMLEQTENRLSGDDEFDDFISPLPPPQSINEDMDDDFGEFASSNLTTSDSVDFYAPTYSNCEKLMIEIDVKTARSQSEHILNEIFPVQENKIANFENIDETKRNNIFEELKDITETNALLYQWSKSNSQKMFLKALNIDMRNILYGPSWNSSMPRFAANLGVTPLEPIKSEILSPTPVQSLSSPSNSSQKNNSDIPTAQFDWSGSGLTNPLDSTSTEPPGNVPEDSSQSHAKSDFLPNETSETFSNLFEADTLQKAVNEQVASPEILNNFELPKSSDDQLDDFSPFQSPKMMIPLRETHISNEIINDFGNKPGWLEPTIVTPDLPRKDPIIDPDEDDEFDDFQMVLPDDTKEETYHMESKSNRNCLPDFSEFETSHKTENSVNSVLDNQEHIQGLTKLESNLFNTSLVNSLIQKTFVKDECATNDDDEFTDFHSHSSLPLSGIITPLHPVPVEPVQPTVQHPISIPTQINWPEPGVTDEDIKNIELTYSRKTELKSNVDKVDVNNKNKTEKKDNSIDEDEWSDFISVNTNTIKTSLPERTSTPDLPLSVLNLNHVQAPKQPIPVITPAGLIQTKLSSNSLLQPKPSSIVQTSIQPNMFKLQSTQFQPSIISNQFAANLFPSVSCSGNGTVTVQSNVTQNQDDDDDWSDFVSSQPLPQFSNGYQQKPTFIQTKTPQTNWTSNAATNIITNPSHFDSFSNYVPQQNKKMTTTKNAIPSISAIPDLEFIAPKNRTKK